MSRSDLCSDVMLSAICCEVQLILRWNSFVGEVDVFQRGFKYSYLNMYICLSSSVFSDIAWRDIGFSCLWSSVCYINYLL